VDVRIAVYNLKGFRLGLDAVIAAVGALDADLLLAQETGSRRALKRLAGELEMQAAADPWSPLRRRVKNAVLARPPWRIVSHRLERFSAGVERLHPRGALVAHAGRAGRRVCAVSSHLGLVPAERVAHAGALLDVVGSAVAGGALALGVDLNETPERRSAKRLTDRYVDAWTAAGRGPGETFPSVDPAARIDYLFVSRHVALREVRVARGARDASDHLPVVADVVLD
jgi:endonuclease/exonuclease/phosphatase family metal-dependent hydrolase